MLAVNLGLMTAGEDVTHNGIEIEERVRGRSDQDTQLSFLLFSVNRVPIIFISFRNRFLTFTPTVT